MEQRLDVLLIEDSPDDAKLVERALRAGGIDASVRRVETRDEFLEALGAKRPDAILADYRLPKFDGLSALRLARERYPDVPLIVVTGTLDDRAAVELLQEGAQDYVLKDRLSRLGAALRRAMERARAEEEKRRSERELREQLDELRRFQRLTVDRELRLIELEAELARLKARGS